MNPLPSISQAYRLLVEEENHKKLIQGSHAVQEEVMTFGANRKNYLDNRFRPSQNRSFDANDSRNKSTYYCDHCKMSGHIIQRCYKIHGYPSNFRNDNRQAAAVQYDDETVT